MKKYILPLLACASLASCGGNQGNKESASAKDDLKTDTLEHIMLKGQAVLPESAALNPANGDLYVGSVGDGSIQKISGSSNTWFYPADSILKRAVSGMAVDAQRQRLWVLNIDIMDPMSGKTGIRVFDLATGSESKNFLLPADKRPHGLNDIAIDKDGNAFISDCFSPILWKANASLDSVSPYMEDSSFTLHPTTFNLNGLAFTPDGKYLIGSVGNVVGKSLNNGEGRMFRIDVASKQLQRVKTTGYEGGDGIAFGNDGNLYTTTMGMGLAKLVFSNNYTEAVATHPTAPQVTSLTKYAPSSVRSYGDRMYVVNSQLDHIFPNSPTYQKPFAPFEITAIPVTMLK